MADSKHNDPDDQVQGARYDLILKAARSLGLDKKKELDPDDVELLLTVAGPEVEHLEPGTVWTYLRNALQIDAVIDIDVFARSDWNHNKHPQFLAKLCRFRPDWARLVFQDTYDRSADYPGRNVNRPFG